MIRSSREIFFLTKGAVSFAKVYPKHEKVLLGVWENENVIVSNDQIRRMAFNIPTCSYQVGNSAEIIETQWRIDQVSFEIVLANEEYVFTDIQADCNRIRIEYHSLSDGNMMTDYFKRVN